MINFDELCEFAKSKVGTPYVYGAKGTVMTKSQIQSLQNQYGKDCVWDSDLNKAGQVCVDCSGLISWATGITRGSQGYFDSALEVVTIDKRDNSMYGWAVWMRGHIGIYLGNDTYVAADGSRYGVRIANLTQNHFTHLLKLCDVDYSRNSVPSIDYETIAKLQEMQEIQEIQTAYEIKQIELAAQLRAIERAKTEERNKMLEEFSISAQVEDVGWMKPVPMAETCGTTGQNKQLEALLIHSKKPVYAKLHLADDGWVNYGQISGFKKEDNKEDVMIGTVGKHRAIECLCFEGNFKYRVHIQNVGWSGWTNADGISTLGTVGQALHIEAIQMQVL